ncbi:LamG-like jellyroll fold domain-containing protein [Verrucomicrobiota bacterium]
MRTRNLPALVAVLLGLAALPSLADPDLVVHYDFDNDDGTNVWDQSGNANHGYTVGTVNYESSISGSAPRFTSQNTYIVAPSTNLNMDEWSNLTVSVWVKPVADGSRNAIIARGGVSSSAVGGFSMTMGGAIQGSGVWNHSGAVAVFTNTLASISARPPQLAHDARPDLGRWYHFVGTYDGTYLRFYFDGVESAVHTNATPIPMWDEAGTKLVIGNASKPPQIDWTDYFFNGQIDEIKIYKRTWTPAEVTQEYEEKTALPPPLETGLVLHYDFNTNAAGVVYDQSTNAFDGTVSGATYASNGLMQGAFSFDGTNDYISTPHDPLLNPNGEDFAISVWVRNTMTLTPGGENNIILFKGIDITHELILFLGPDAQNGATLRYRIGGTSEELKPSVSKVDLFNDHQWHHVVVSIDEGASTEGTMYIDGVPVGTRDSFTLSIDPSEALQIGKKLARQFDGDMDGLRIYDRALSSGEVLELYNTGANPDLVLHYTFDNDSGTDVWDRSGHGNHGYTVGTINYENSIDGLAPRFTSKNTYIVTPSTNLNMDGWNGVTVSAWVKLKADGSRNRVMGRGGLSNEDTGGFALGMGGAIFGSPTWNHSGAFSVYTNAPAAVSARPPQLVHGTHPELDRWYHFVGTYDGTYTRFYFDGDEAAVTTNSTSRPVSDTPGTKFVIGNVGKLPQMTWSDYFFNGVIDEVRIYKMALQPQEVAELYAAPTDNSIILTVAGAPAAYSESAPYDYGASSASVGQTITNTVVSPHDAGSGTRYVCNGWTGTGDVPASGSDTTVVFTVSQDSQLTWDWNTEYWLDSTAGANGSVDVGDGWHTNGAQIVITATPNEGYRFVMWSGDVPSEDLASNPLTLTMHQARSISAVFDEYQTGIEGGRVLYYSCSASNAATVTDDSGNGHHGTIYGATWSPTGIVDGAYSFDGGNDYIGVPHHADLNPNGHDYSISVWLKLDAALTPGGENQIILFKGVDITHEMILFLGPDATNGAELRYRIGGSSQTLGPDVSQTNVLNDLGWHHLVVVVDEGATTEGRMYLDGELIGTRDTFTLNINPSQTLQIGRKMTKYFGGDIDELMIYERALSPGEVAQLHGKGISKFLKVHYTFDADDGVNVWDQSGNGNHGYTVGTINYEDSISGLAPRFTSKNTYILSDSTNLNMDGWSACTISTWVNLKADGSRNRIMDRGGISNGDYGGFALTFGGDISGGPERDHNGTFHVHTNVAAAAYTTVYPPEFSIGTTPEHGRWYHLVGTYDGTYQRFYVDGQLSAASTNSTPGALISDKPGTKFMIGKVGYQPQGDWSDYFFNGCVDEVRIYNCALDAQQVTNLYVAGSAQNVLLTTEGSPETGTPTPYGYGAKLIPTGTTVSNAVAGISPVPVQPDR